MFDPGFTVLVFGLSCFAMVLIGWLLCFGCFHDVLQIVVFCGSFSWCRESSAVGDL